MLKHKFHAKPTKLDGIKFASKKEANCYCKLKQKQKDGEILFFLRQTPFHLPGGVKYVADFVTFNTDETVHIIDCKGFKTEVYKSKKKMVEATYPITIEEV